MLPRNCVRSGANSLNHTGSRANNLQNKKCPCLYQFPLSIFYGTYTQNTFDYMQRF